MPIITPPNLVVPQDVCDLIYDYYRNLDDKASVDAFADLFTDDAALITPSVSLLGKRDIRNHKVEINAMWERTGTWEHQLERIFPFGQGLDVEWYMLNLSGKLKPLPGVKESSGESAVRLQVSRSEERLPKLRFVQVYLCKPPLDQSALSR